MITGSVPASDLDPKKGLRAEDYLIDPLKMADRVIDKWWDNYPAVKEILKVKGTVFCALKGFIAEAVREAYERGQRNPKE